MGEKDQRVDAYIAKAANFARSILTRLRALVHEACPGARETMKWSFPHFDYKGMMCSMAAFKGHCTFGFWKASLMADPHGLLAQSEAAMGQFGQIKSAEDLPPRDVLIAYIKEAARLNEEGVKAPSRPRATGPKELTVPDYFTAALKENPRALETFENFRYSHRKEYVEWIREARTEETRNRRLAAAIEWLAEGKPRHWKYAVK